MYFCTLKSVHEKQTLNAEVCRYTEVVQIKRRIIHGSAKHFILQYMKKLFTLSFVILAIFLSLSSCSKVKREIIVKQVAATKSHLPQKIGAALEVVDVNIKGDMVEYVIKMSEDIWRVSGMTNETANSDRNIANLLSSIDDFTISNYIGSDMGIKYTYYSDETSKKLFEIEISPSRLKEIHKKMKNGEIKEASMLETIQQEIMRVKSNLPAPIGDGVWMTDVYLKNKNVYYVYKIDDGISASDCTKEDIELVKAGCIEALRGEQTIVLRKKKLIEEGIHLIFVYNDSEGKEITRVDIGPDELSKL